jgi:hypothetical protein
LPHFQSSSIIESNTWALAFEIFTANLIFSAFVFVTLPGFVLFPAPMVLIVYRGLTWGSYLYYISPVTFFASLPTIILEGEAYVFACVAGMIVGVSWVKPSLLYEDLNRRESLRLSTKECLKLYAVVTVLLAFGALVESVTISLL